MVKNTYIEPSQLVAYKSEETTLLLRNTKIAALLTFILYPSALILDYYVYPGPSSKKT